MDMLDYGSGSSSEEEEVVVPEKRVSDPKQPEKTREAGEGNPQKKVILEIPLSSMVKAHFDNPAISKLPAMIAADKSLYNPQRFDADFEKGNFDFSDAFDGKDLVFAEDSIHSLMKAIDDHRNGLV